MIGIQKVMKIRNITPLQLSQSIGVSKQQVNSWFNGTRNIPNIRLGDIAHALSVSIEMLSRELTREEIINLYKSEIEKEIGEEVIIGIGGNNDEYKFKI